MLRDVERASNPWGKPQTERADWAAGLGVRVLEPGEPRARGALLGRLRRVVRRARAHRGRVDREAAAGGGRRLRDPRPARVVHRRPRAADGQRVHVPGARRAEREHAQRGGRDEDRRQLPALLQHARQRVPATSAATTRSCTTPSCSPSSCATGGCTGAGDRARSPTTTPATSPATTTCSPPRARSSPRIGKPLEMARSGKRTFCCGAGGAHMWMEERGGQINEERAREAAATGADTLAVACPFCTVMLDDGVKARGSDMRVVDVSTLIHLPRLLLSSPPQRRAGRPARAGGGGRTADRDGALR